MQTAVTVVHIFMAIVLMVSVLLQAGKSSGLGAAFGGSSSSVFGARGPASFIGKITCLAAVVFMVTSFTLALYARGAGTSSLIPDDPVEVPATTDAPQTTDALPSDPSSDAGATPGQASSLLNTPPISDVQEGTPSSPPKETSPASPPNPAPSAGDSDPASKDPQDAASPAEGFPSTLGSSPSSPEANSSPSDSTSPEESQGSFAPTTSVDETTPEGPTEEPTSEATPTS